MKRMYKETTNGKEEDEVDDPKEGTKQGYDIVFNYKKRKIEFIDFDKKNRKIIYKRKIYSNQKKEPRR